MEANVIRELAYSAGAVWGLISNFGNRDWSPSIDKVVMEGEGVGAVRYMYVGDRPPCAERLEALDHSTMHMTYSIVENNPLPLDNFLGSVQVKTIDSSNCQVIWGASGSASGKTEAEVTIIMQTTYNGILDAVETHLNSL
jgi:hypothetical protein